MLKHIKKKDLITSTWSGGTTTELAIGPDGSNYQERDFGWRISTASVDVEESTFSKLPGVKRYIMSLTSDLRLSHRGHHDILLKPYEVDCFWGDWDTESHGKVVDFNLMLKGLEGDLEAIHVGSQISMQVKRNQITCLYCKENAYAINVNQKTLAIEAGDFVLIDSECFIEVNTEEAISLVVARIDI